MPRSFGHCNRSPRRPTGPGSSRIAESSLVEEERGRHEGHEHGKRDRPGATQGFGHDTLLFRSKTVRPFFSKRHASSGRPRKSVSPSGSDDRSEASHLPRRNNRRTDGSRWNAPTPSSHGEAAAQKQAADTGQQKDERARLGPTPGGRDRRRLLREHSGGGGGPL